MAVPENIVAAAILINGTIHTLPPPARHHTIMWKCHDDGVPGEAFRNGDQGFVTNEGRFVDREEAARIAVAAGQIAEPKWGPELFSEDLW